MAHRRQMRVIVSGHDALFPRHLVERVELVAVFQEMLMLKTM